jgi:uncharacterized protein (TIGR01777 family)
MSLVLISGGTGLIGTNITQKLVKKGYQVVILTRKDRTSSNPSVSFSKWDIDNQIIDEELVATADYIIHLAGANVAEKRWSKKRKKVILDSRVKSGELLCKVILKNTNRLKAFVAASAIGWYGPDPKIPNPTPFREEMPHFNDFLGTTCYQWENSLQPIENVGINLIKLRTGIVLSKEGGAIKEFKKPIKYGFATVMGNGKQMVSWIHIDDLARLYISAMEDVLYTGVYNAVAPALVNNANLITELARQMKGKYFSEIKIPGPLLKIVLGEMSIEVLKSATVSNDKLTRQGFIFQYPTLPAALEEIFN